MGNETETIDEATTAVRGSEAAAGKTGQPAAPAAEDAGSDLSGKASDAGQSVRDAAGRAARAVGDGYDRMTERAFETVQQGQDAAREAIGGIEVTIQQRPFVAILIAAVVGCLLGLLFVGRKAK